MTKSFILAAMLAALFGPAIAMAQGASDLDKVRSLNDAFDAALSRRDITAVDASWAQDAKVTAIHPASKAPVVGWDAVRKSWEGAFAAFPELAVTLRQPVIRVNGNSATVVGVETIKGRRPNGEQVEFEAVTTNIYEKQGERWLMVHHQASRIPQ